MEDFITKIGKEMKESVNKVTDYIELQREILDMKH